MLPGFVPSFRLLPPHSPYPLASETMSRKGRSNEGTLGVFFQNRELLEDRVLPIAGDDVNHFELVLHYQCPGLNRILQRSISNQHDNRAASSKLLLSQRHANRRGRIVT